MMVYTAVEEGRDKINYNTGETWHELQDCCF